MDRDPPGFGSFVCPKWLDPWSSVACPLVRCPIHRDKLAHIVEDLRRSATKTEGNPRVFNRQIPEVSIGLIVDKPQRWVPLSFHGWVLFKTEDEGKNNYKCKKTVKWSCLGGVCVVVFKFVEFFLMQRVQEPCPRNVGTRIAKTHFQCIHF